MKRFLSFGLYALVLFGIGYFVYNAFVSQNVEAPITSQAESLAIDNLKKTGLFSFKLKNLDGTSFDSSSIDSKVVIVNFWASWCAPCIEEFPSLIRLLNTFNGKVMLLAVSVDSDENQIKQFLKNFNIYHKDMVVLLDPSYSLAEKFGTFKIPESYIFDSNKIFLKKVSGSIDWSSSDTIEYFKGLSP